VSMTTFLEIVAGAEFLLIVALVFLRLRPSMRERLLQRDNERLQTANADLLDRTMHMAERTWTPPPEPEHGPAEEPFEIPYLESIDDAGVERLEDDPILKAYREAERHEAALA
jgi:hypothetical protein